MLAYLVLCFIAVSFCNAEECSNQMNYFSQNYNCTYTVQYEVNSHCKTYTFSSCNVQPNNPSLNAFQLNDRIECSQYCCANANSGNPFCSPLAESSQNIVMIIVALSIFIFLIVALFCLYRFGEDCCYCIHRCFRRSNNEIINSHPSAHLINETQSNIHLFNSKKWEEEHEKMQVTECSVCLCEDPNFQLPCGHIYHHECIFQCFKRKYECILCRRTNLTLFKLYCKKCHLRYKKLYYFQLKDLQSKEGKMCDSCTLEDQLKVEVIE